MDPVTMTYYATVCAALSLGAGRLRSALMRIAAGVVVGLIAAALLPSVRAAVGL
jgi:hypothetical protein